jgi:lipopolysaccharide export system protein LptA
MRWQKIARFAIAVFVLGFGAFVFLAMRQRVAVSSRNGDADKVDPNLVMSSGPGKRQDTKFGKLNQDLTYEKALTYKDGRTVLLGVKLTLPDRNGRTFLITADEGESLAPPDKPLDLSGAKLRGHVKLTTDNGLEVLADDATYDKNDGLVKVPGPVTFTRGRMKGSGVGATYDENRDVLWLLAEARLTVTPDAAGGGAVDATASKAGLARAENFVKLEGSARLTADTRTAEADVITAFLDEKGEKIQRMELREHSRITGTGAGAQTMTARHIDMIYAADGRTLQVSKLMEGGVIESPGAAGATGQRIAGTTIESIMSPDGATVVSLTAQENVQVDLPAEGQMSAKRIRSASLRATGAAGQGLQNAVFEGSVDYLESRPATGKTPALERHATSNRLIVDTKPGLGPVERADFRGNAHFVDGDLTADAPRALYNIEGDELTLSPSAGDAGKPPILNGRQLTVQALNIRLSPSTQKLEADTDVRSIIKPQKPAGPAPAAAGGRGAAPAAAAPGQTRMPVMLKQDRPVNVTSNRLDYDGVSEATYTGNALLWQDKSRIAAETIVLNDRTGNLTGRGSVRTTMLFEDEDPKTKVRKPTVTNANADMLVYDDAKRLATYTATGKTPATLMSVQGDMSGDRIDLYLKESGSELDRAEVDGNVTVKLETLFATGKHLVYSADTDTHVLTGDPVVSVKKDEQGACKESRGNTMTYQRATDNIRVEAMAGIATETKPLPACPAELRH